MICPRCNTTLAISLMSGIEIDYCPNCRGVWLDKGELEKLIERSNSYSPGYSDGYQERQNYNDHHGDHHQDDHHDNYYKGDGHNGRRKKGFLGDLFDF